MKYEKIEKRMLSLMLSSKIFCERICRMLKGDHFWEKGNRTIFICLVYLHASNNVSKKALKKELKDRTEISYIKIVTGIPIIETHGLTFQHIIDDIDALLDRERKRLIGNVLEKAMLNLNKDKWTSARIKGFLSEKLKLDGRISTELKRLTAIDYEKYGKTYIAYNQKFRSGCLYGFTGRGKSTFLLNLMDSLARQHKCLYITYEVPVGVCYERYKGFSKHLDITILYGKNYSEVELTTVVLEDRPDVLFVDGCADADMETYKDIARSHGITLIYTSQHDLVDVDVACELSFLSGKVLQVTCLKNRIGSTFRKKYNIDTEKGEINEKNI